MQYFILFLHVIGAVGSFCLILLIAFEIVCIFTYVENRRVTGCPVLERLLYPRQYIPTYPAALHDRLHPGDVSFVMGSKKYIALVCLLWF
uniref:Secreted protein n=1 Tax=Panagrellus redivivus TaxID=6233 RepID=A0A7E4WB55_PANRE